MPYRNGRYMTDDELRGYEARERHDRFFGYASPYDGGYDYRKGWDEYADDARHERYRMEERQREEAEERAAENRRQEAKRQEEEQCDAYCAEMDARAAEEAAYNEAMARAEEESMQQEAEEAARAAQAGE